MNANDYIEVKHDADNGSIRKNRNGQAICRSCKKVVTMESLLAAGLSPMWRRGVLVSHKH